MHAGRVGMDKEFSRSLYVDINKGLLSLYGSIFDAPLSSMASTKASTLLSLP